MAQGIKQDDEYAGVKPIEERHRINEAGLDRWMRQNIEDYLGPLNVLQFKGGQSNPTYRLDTPGASRLQGRLGSSLKKLAQPKEGVGIISRSEIREQRLAVMLSRSCHDRGLLTL